MKTEKSKIDSGGRILDQIREIENLHPYKMIAYLAVFGSLLLMLFLMVSFTFELASESDVLEIDLIVPKFYFISGVLLPFTYFYIARLPEIFKTEDAITVQKRLLVTFIIGMIFLIFQLSGWLEWIYKGIEVESGRVGTYLYVITGLYMLHVLATMVIMTIKLYQIRNLQHDGIKQLLYFTSTYEKMKLEIISIIWRYLIILWLILIIWFNLIF